VLVAAGCVVSALSRYDGDGSDRELHPLAHTKVLFALRTQMHEAPSPLGAAALSLLAAGVSVWWACLPPEPSHERMELVDEALQLCERLAAASPGERLVTELMVAREASAELLQALVSCSPAYFLDSLGARLNASDSAAHMTAFLALIHCLQAGGGALLLRPHLERSLETVCLALQPLPSQQQGLQAFALGQRRNCATGAAGFLAELQLRLPGQVSAHRMSSRTAIAVPASGRALLRVYDTGSAAGLLRVLEAAPDESLSDCVALAFDADGGRVAAYHADADGGHGWLRFWVLAVASLRARPAALALERGAVAAAQAGRPPQAGVCLGHWRGRGAARQRGRATLLPARGCGLRRPLMRQAGGCIPYIAS
jgi:hypothetical protein